MVFPMTRRSFNAGGLLAVSTATARTAGAAQSQDPIRVAFIGVGNRGGQLLEAFTSHPDVRVTALCDVDQLMLDKAAKRFEGSVALESDFRRILDRSDVDAVVIASPDHWHAIHMTMACAAGKDVYVEKPLSVTVVEGRTMVEAAARHGRVVQVGLHRRSSPALAALAERVRAGLLGHVSVARAYRINNMAPAGIGRVATTQSRPGLDWDMWLGPRPLQPYQANITPYRFRWWQGFSSQIANWGVHYLDAIRWCTGDDAPDSVCTMGGRFAVDDDRTIPDTAETILQFPAGRLAIFGQYEASGAPALGDAEFELRGVLGTCLAGERGHVIIPEQGGQFQDRGQRMAEEREVVELSNKELTSLHARNFLDCIRSRAKPNADVETGHRSTTLALLANISLAVGERLEWDPKAERFLGSTAANDLLHYEYRGTWRLP
jgi:predicted dehydrogenase